MKKPQIVEKLTKQRTLELWISRLMLDQTNLIFILYLQYNFTLKGLQQLKRLKIDSKNKSTHSGNRNQAIDIVSFLQKSSRFPANRDKFCKEKTTLQILFFFCTCTKILYCLRKYNKIQ